MKIVKIVIVKKMNLMNLMILVVVVGLISLVVRLNPEYYIFKCNIVKIQHYPKHYRKV